MLANACQCKTIMTSIPRVAYRVEGKGSGDSRALGSESRSATVGS
jgi:hypothetical protein